MNTPTAGSGEDTHTSARMLAGGNPVSPAVQLHDDLPLWPPFELVDDVLEQTRTDLPGLPQLTTVNEAASMRRTLGPGKAPRLMPIWR